MPPLGDRLIYRNHAKVSGRSERETQEERELARRWRTLGDREALQQLVTRHMGLVLTIAREFRRVEHLSGDLVQEGYLGLTIAAQRFDPDRAACLATYATYWIRARMLDLVVRSHGPVRIGTTRWQRRIFFKLERARSVQEAQSGGLDRPSLARGLGVGEDELEWMMGWLSARDFALDGSPLGDRDPIGRVLAAEAPDPEEAAADVEEAARLKRLLGQAMKDLDPREAFVVGARYLKEPPDTLDSLGRRLGVTRERVRQIETAAKWKLRAACRIRRGDPSPTSS